jgi:uncharacterized protein (TIGR02001 family)
MRKSFQTTLLGSAVACAVALSGAAQALDLSGNVEVTNNYIWRGKTQTDDQAAVQGGVDLGTDLGLYVGTWLSNVDFGGDKGYEMDIYGGFAGDLDKFGYDLGVLTYRYPVQDDLNFTEVYGGGSYAFTDAFSASAMLYYTVSSEAGGDDDNLYYVGNLDYKLDSFANVLKDVDVGAYVGRYDFDDNNLEDYTHWGLKIGKGTDYGDFSFAYDQNDDDQTSSKEDDPRFTALWSFAVDL